MIAFISLFLGLVSGTQTIEVAVSPEVVRVEVLLDGARLGELYGEPWVLRCDLGQELLPRELVAVAFDSSGAEVGRDQQWLNLPQRAADAKILPVFDGSDEVSGARVIWESPGYADPGAIEALLDGRPVAVAADGIIDLAQCDLAATHLLNVTVRFAPSLTVERELLFGGGRTAVTATDLTAVAVQLDPGVRLPPADEMAGWLVSAGAELEVRAVERGPANVVVVRDLGTGADLDRLFKQWRRRRSRMQPSTRFTLHALGALEEGDTLQLIEPVPVGVANRARPTRLFPRQVQDADERHGLFAFLVSESLVPEQPRQLADAVAVAGAAAVKDNRRRAVVVLLGSGSEESSNRSVLASREYLGCIQVPIVVWNMSGRSSRKVDREWGSSHTIETFEAFRDQVDQLHQMLERQRIVWVAGSHAPHQISLGPEAQGVTLAGALCCGCFDHR